MIQYEFYLFQGYFYNFIFIQAVSQDFPTSQL